MLKAQAETDGEPIVVRKSVLPSDTHHRDVKDLDEKVAKVSYSVRCTFITDKVNIVHLLKSIFLWPQLPLSQNCCLYATCLPLTTLNYATNILLFHILIQSETYLFFFFIRCFSLCVNGILAKWQIQLILGKLVSRIERRGMKNAE